LAVWETVPSDRSARSSFSSSHVRSPIDRGKDRELFVPAAGHERPHHLNRLWAVFFLLKLIPRFVRVYDAFCPNMDDMLCRTEGVKQKNEEDFEN
jgi:hypothetical protein